MTSIGTIEPLNPPYPGILSQVGSAVSMVDENIIDCWASFRDTAKAWRTGNWEGILDGGSRHITAWATLSYYTLAFLRTLDQLILIFNNMPGARETLFVLGLTIFGFIADTLVAIQETIAVIRQSIFYFKNLDEVNALSKDALINRLGEDYVTNNDIVAGQIREEDLEKLKHQAFKKQVMHIIGLLSAALFILSSLAGPQAAVSVVPLAIGFVLWIVRYYVKKGWVDNPEQDGSFSYTNAFPACIAKLFINEIPQEQEASAPVENVHFLDDPAYRQYVMRLCSTIFTEAQSEAAASSASHLRIQAVPLSS
jgi:hypothetical protein